MKTTTCDECGAVMTGFSKPDGRPLTWDVVGTAWAFRIEVEPIPTDPTPTPPKLDLCLRCVKDALGPAQLRRWR